MPTPGIAPKLDETVRACLFKSRNCAQTSFAVLQEQFELDGDTVLKALTAFPGRKLSKG